MWTERVIVDDLVTTELQIGLAKTSCVRQIKLRWFEPKYLSNFNTKRKH